MSANCQPPKSPVERDRQPSPWHGFAADPIRWLGEWLWLAILHRVPLGYQDETGFHFGVPLPRAEIA